MRLVPACGAFLLAIAAFAGEGGTSGIIALETDTFSLALDAGGRVLHFKDALTGNDYLDRTGNLAFAAVKKGSQYHAATGALLKGDRLELAFAEVSVVVALRVAPEHRRLVLEVTSVEGEGIDEVVFAQVPLTLQGDLSEPFGASLLALNLKTNCLQYPGASSELGGFTAYRRFGFAGACGAIVAGPMSELRDALKDAVTSSPDLPHTPLGGPWALDAEINQGSYVIDGGGTVTEANVGAWIDVARQTGARNRRVIWRGVRFGVDDEGCVPLEAW